VYTFVSLWQIPRANWAQFSENSEKITNPILQKMLSDGTIISWGSFETVVHTPDGMTHGGWFQATSLAGITRVLDELLKGASRPALNTATKHEDYLLRTLARHGRRAWKRRACPTARATCWGALRITRRSECVGGAGSRAEFLP